MLNSIPYVVLAALAYYMITKAVDAGFVDVLKESMATIEEVETGADRHRDEMMGLLEGNGNGQ